MQTEVAAAIVAVTVYPSGAQITRTGQGEVDGPGEHSVRIVGLPRTMLRDSLRAEGRGPEGTRIVSVDTAVEYHPAAPEETLARLRDQIAEVERSVKLTANKQQAIAEQQAWLRVMGEQSGRSLAWGVARGTAKPEDARALFAYASEEGERLATQALDAQRESEDLQRKLAALQRELQRLQGTAGSDRLSAEVRLLTQAAGPVELTLTYVVGQASWVPRYDARVDRDRATMLLSQQAIVRQHSGESWDVVSMTISSARPSLATSLPDDPPPWYVDAARPVPIPEPRAMRAARPQQFMLRAGAAESAATIADSEMQAPVTASLAPAEWQAPEAERAGAAQVFHVADGAGVPSDGEPHVFGMGDFELPGRLEYVVMPATAAGAHLRAVASNATGRVLLPGTLHVFYTRPTGDEFVGATPLELTAEGSDLTLYLGLDDNVTVKRQLIERDTDKGSLLQRGVRIVTLAYRTTLVNRTAASRRVIVKDSLPLTRHEKIKVRALDIRPQPSERTKLDQLTWDLTLAADETRQIEWRCSVESPADLEITPLP